jgi:adenosine deaminase
VVSFGLDGDEAAFGPEWFQAAFATAKDAGLLATPHAGELRGPASVAAAVDLLQADRVLHGVRAVEDPTLVARLAESGVCLDVCPTSNVKLSVVSEMARHPLPQLLDAGVACSLNADDPLLFASSLAGEYRIARDVLGLDDSALAGIARASIDHCGAPDDLRSRAHRGIDQWESPAPRREQ